MKNAMIKKMLLMSVSLLVIGFAQTVFAHEQGGILGNAANAVDYYQINCTDDGTGPADHLVVAIMDAAPKKAPLLSVQVTKGKLAQNTTDSIDGDAAFSPEVSLQGGNGAYYVTIDKTKAGPEVYTLDYHCITASNEHTGTDIFNLQNQ
jgi:hypothetical protein